MLGKRTGLKVMDLKEFIHHYSLNLEEYYGEYFGSEVNGELFQNQHQNVFIFCLVDMSENLFSTSKKPSLRRGGVTRRRKIKHRYSYENPMNRIHGYLIAEKLENPLIPENKKIISLSLICSSIFSEKRGIGSDLMDILFEFSKKSGLTDVVLEVANDYAHRGFEYWEEEQSEDEDDEQAEESEDEDDEQAEESEDDEEEWYPCDDALEIISHELWRKVMRKGEDNIPYYNVDGDYIWENLYNYFFPEEYHQEEKQEKSPIIIENPNDPKDYEYGGFWFKKGYESQIGLIEFYKKFGFYDEPKVHLDWNCFEKEPFPSMICPL